MDPVSLAGAALGLLVPYIRQAADKVADKAVDRLAEGAVPAVGRLYAAVKTRLGRDEYGAGQLVGVEAKPDSAGRQQALQAALVEVLEEDPAFAAVLARLVREAEHAGGVQAQVGRIEGTAAIGGTVTQRGTYVAGHDITFRADPAGPDEGA